MANLCYDMHKRSIKNASFLPYGEKPIKQHSNSNIHSVYVTSARIFYRTCSLDVFSMNISTGKETVPLRKIHAASKHFSLQPVLAEGALA